MAWVWYYIINEMMQFIDVHEKQMFKLDIHNKTISILYLLLHH
jgi:hypothetical protein